jgi:poly-gamma-glutamate capsule biosynthesis protein CapA/YwtB (metallophosphatase superfamily)
MANEVGSQSKGATNMKVKWRYRALILALVLATVAGCAPSIAQKTEQIISQPQTNSTPGTIETTTAQVTSEPPSTPPPVKEEESRFPETRVSVMAVGDIMVHDQQLEGAWNAANKSYDFLPSFQHVQPLFQEADWVIGNLETTLTGQEARYSGYPMFNSPESLAKTLIDVGFTAVSTANNHSLDRKEKGVLGTIEHLDQVGLLHTGTFRSPQERDEPLMLSKDGLTMGMLSYSYGTNGIPIPEGKSYLVNLIDPALIKKDIARAREKGADLVAVSLHFGDEYKRMPNAFQKQIAEQCLQFGADLILGHHPHVVQPFEWKTVTLEDGQQHKGLIAYSLGNFISAQRWDYKDVGAILKLTLYKGENGEASIENAEMIPTYVYYSKKNGKRSYVIYPVPQTLAKLQNGAKDVNVSKEAIQYMKQLNEEIPVHVTKEVTPKKAS